MLLDKHRHRREICARRTSCRSSGNATALTARSPRSTSLWTAWRRCRSWDRTHGEQAHARRQLTSRDRVVCVVTTGQAWQFKPYKWMDPKVLFRHVKGVYFHFHNEPVAPAIRDWNVSEMKVSLMGSDRQLTADQQVRPTHRPAGCRRVLACHRQPQAMSSCRSTV